MRITDISISMEALENLGDYTNTRPKVELRAALDPTDNVNTAIAQLTMIAQRTLREIIDDEREAHNLAPRYYDGPLYAVVDFPRYNTLALVPATATNDLKGEWFARTNYLESRRLASAEKLLAEQMQNKHPSYEVFDCGDGDLTPLLAYLGLQKAKEEGRSKTTVRVEASVHQPGEFDDDEDDDDDEIGF